MSGGSMNYLCYAVAEAEFEQSTPERKALRRHLLELSEVLRKIEWNDSGDGAVGESEAIRDCIGNDAVLASTIEDAHQISKELRHELERACGKAGMSPNN